MQGCKTVILPTPEGAARRQTSSSKFQDAGFKKGLGVLSDRAPEFDPQYWRKESVKKKIYEY